MGRLRCALVASSLLAASLLGAVSAGAAAPAAGRTPDGPRPAAERLSLRAGLQVGAKHSSRPTVTVAGRRYLAADPAVAELPTGSQVDTSYWRARGQVLGARRMAARGSGPARSGGRRTPVPLSYPEHEPSGVVGANDDAASSEHLVDLGVGRPAQAVRVTGRLSRMPVTAARRRTSEDQGDIAKATRTRIRAQHERILVRSRIGDGPHGRAGDGHGDFDFFRVHVNAGRSVVADTGGSVLDTVLVLYDAAGHVVASNDDADTEVVTSSLSYRVPRSGYYYLMVAGFNEHGSVPASPFHSGSGVGVGAQGRYRLSLAVTPLDRDYFGVRLSAGDVLGGALVGAGADVSVHGTDGRGLVGSKQDLSASYPPESPLPGGGSSFAYVAEEAGWYTVSVQDGVGAYSLELETYPPGTAGAGVQTVFLDFDGARLNTGMFGGSGVSTLSPLRAFLTRWGLTSADEGAVVDATVASFEEDIDRTLAASGLNPRLRVRVLNSRHDADPWGQPNVSRVVVGGTIDQTGVVTIGVSQSVDPGNYAHEETAMVLLDTVSGPAGPRDSLNTYLAPGSDRVGFVGHALGNLVAHETGHLIGSFHTDNADATVNLMDAGGADFRSFFGVGPDHVGGTADDVDVDFGTDRYARTEGFTGLEDTLNTSAWAFVGP